MKEIFELLHNRIMQLDPSIEQDIKKAYIAYKIVFRRIVDIYPTEKSLKLTLNINIDEIFDPRELCKDISEWHHNGNTQVTISSSDDLEDVMDLIKQVLKQDE